MELPRPVCPYLVHPASGAVPAYEAAPGTRGTTLRSEPQVVMMHAPWYNSNSGHRAEAELMRQDMEELLYSYGVDLVLSGHVHAYERSAPVFQGCLNPCGPVYLNLGDGGNREGTYIPWREPRPAWSDFRESSFGVGMLTVHNATHAYYNWSRSACEALDSPSTGNINLSASSCVSASNKNGRTDNAAFFSVSSDRTWLVRPVQRMPLRIPSTWPRSAGTIPSSPQAGSPLC